MKTGENDVNQLQYITKKLNELEIINHKLLTEIKKVKEEIKEFKEKEKEKSANKEIEYKKYLAHEKENTFEKGDTIQILNPTKTSETTGKVLGSTNTGYVRIKTNTGRITRRLPRNLRITHKA